MPTSDAKKFSKDMTAKARLDKGLRERLTTSHERYNTNDTDTIILLLEAYLAATEREDAVRLPLTITMAPKDAEQALRAAAEEQGNPYRVSPTAQIEADEVARRDDLSRAKKSRRPRA